MSLLMGLCLQLWFEAVAMVGTATRLRPGLSLRLPWVAELDGRFNRNAVASAGTTRSGLIRYALTYPGLKQRYHPTRAARLGIPVLGFET